MSSSLSSQSSGDLILESRVHLSVTFLKNRGMRLRRMCDPRRVLIESLGKPLLTNLISTFPYEDKLRLFIQLELKRGIRNLVLLTLVLMLILRNSLKVSRQESHFIKMKKWLENIMRALNTEDRHNSECEPGTDQLETSSRMRWGFRGNEGEKRTFLFGDPNLE